MKNPPEILNKIPQPKPSKVQMRETLWARGDISTFLLDSAQKDFDKRIKSSDEKIQVILSSRRLGKTFYCMVLAVEYCLRNPKTIVKFLAPTKIMINEIVGDIMPKILESCPEELKPQQMKSKYSYIFTNGSKIQLAGSDSGHAEKLRGSFAHLCIVDEAGFCNDLTNTVKSVLLPTTLNTRGKIILLSTPPKDLEHDFLSFVEEADAKGTLIKKTIYDNPRITAEEIAEIEAAYPGGRDNLEFRREFLCEIQKNTELAVVPEFDDLLEKKIVQEWPRPAFFDSYVSMDLGFKDLTVVLFAYYDFKRAKVVIEDELVMNFQESNNNIRTLMENIALKEAALFTDALTHELKAPYLRISDINHIVTKEISVVSGGRMNFVPATKDDKQAAINNLRVMVSGEKVIINPKCKVLIRHLKNAKWSKSNKNVFDRSVDNGHYDAVDALNYLLRGIVYGKNPYPRFHGMDSQDLYVVNNKPQESVKDIATIKALFNVRK